jgi:hypothetical protein
MEDRGCDYCRDDQSMYYGHVEQFASNEDRGVLLRCPRCGWLDLDPHAGLSEPRHISALKAGNWFGFLT